MMQKVNNDLMNKLLGITEERNNRHIERPEAVQAGADDDPKTIKQMKKPELLELATALAIEGVADMTVDELRTAIEAVQAGADA